MTKMNLYFSAGLNTSAISHAERKVTLTLLRILLLEIHQNRVR